MLKKYLIRTLQHCHKIVLKLLDNNIQAFRKLESFNNCKQNVEFLIGEVKTCPIKISLVDKIVTFF